MHAIRGQFSAVNFNLWKFGLLGEPWSKVYQAFWFGTGEGSTDVEANFQFQNFSRSIPKSTFKLERRFEIHLISSCYAEGKSLPVTQSRY